MRHLTRSTIAALAAMLICGIALTTPASAHIDASPMVDGDNTMVMLTMGHGCTDEGATGLRVQLPEGAANVSAKNPAGWTSVVSATEIAWSGGPQSPHEELDFEFTLRLAQPAGTTVLFPAIETCGSTEIAWIEQTVEGQPEPDHPAPSIVVGGTTGTTMHMSMDEDKGSAAGTTDATMAPVDSPITDEAVPTNNVGLVVLLVVMAIIIGGAVILFLRNRKPRNPA